MLKKLKIIIKYIWQLPQNLIGLVILLLVKPKKYKDYYIWNTKSISASFGQYIFINPNASEFIILHEKGHQKQSLLLGWLMIPFISIPSLFWSLIYKKTSKPYWWFYTERFANYLMHI